MTKNIAICDKDSKEFLLSSLLELGYTIAHPNTGEIIGWDSDGEEVLLSSSQNVLSFLSEGHGLQLWKNEQDDIFMSIIHEKPRLYFDGYTVDEEKEITAILESRGLYIKLVHEDDAE